MHDDQADDPSPLGPESGRTERRAAVAPPTARVGAPPPPPAFLKAPPVPSPPPAASLFDSDAPMMQEARPPAQASAVTPPQRSDGSRSDWMFELDAPTRGSSKDIELDHAAIEAAAAAAAEATSLSADPSLPPVAEAVPDPSFMPGFEAEMRRVDMPTPARPDTAEGQLQRRVDRVVLRIQTCRDALRIIGTLDLKDEERKPVARQLLELGNAVLGPTAGVALIKEPEATVADASREQLDELERMLGPVEDKLLALDELVPAATFEARIDGGKHGKKAMARYGRLLASRRIQGRERRNRLEWIANRLLSKTDDTGRRTALPPARARQVLDHLIGGLAPKVDGSELTEALAFVRETMRRLEGFTSHDEFFDSECYFDVHGHKVTMRDLMVVPEYLYMAVVLNVRLHNRIEGWIDDRDRLLNSNQVRGEQSLRAQVHARMREQEQAAEEALGFLRKGPTLAVLRPEDPKPAAKPAPKERAKRPRFDLGIGWDRNLVIVAACVLVALGSGAFLVLDSGAVGTPTVQALTRDALAELSPLLTRGWYIGKGEDQMLRASIGSGSWTALEPRQRREQADRLASVLKSRGIHNAEISENSAVIIAIRDGFVEQVQGGKL